MDELFDRLGLGLSPRNRALLLTGVGAVFCTLLWTTREGLATAPGGRDEIITYVAFAAAYAFAFGVFSLVFPRMTPVTKPGDKMHGMLDRLEQTRRWKLRIVSLLAAVGNMLMFR